METDRLPPDALELRGPARGELRGRGPTCRTMPSRSRSRPRTESAPLVDDPQVV